MKRKLIRVIGMSRSGIHAVAEWIRMSYALEGYSAQYDNMAHLDRLNEIAKFLPPKGEMEEAFLWMVEHEDIQFIDMPTLSPKIYTNFELIDVLVVRDVFNTMASRRKMNTSLFSRRSVQMWKQYAFEASGATNFLGSGAKTVVLFDSWHKDNDYRAGVSKSLGIEGVGAETSKQSQGQSSWQPPTTPVKELMLFDRWRNYADDATFWSVFKGDRQLYDLNTTLFGANEEILAKL